MEAPRVAAVPLLNTQEQNRGGERERERDSDRDSDYEEDSKQHRRWTVWCRVTLEDPNLIIMTQ